MIQLVINHLTSPGKEVKLMVMTKKENGQGLVEYALIMVLVTLVVIVALALLGPAVGSIFSNIIPLL